VPKLFYFEVYDMVSVYFFIKMISSSDVNKFHVGYARTAAQKISSWF